MWLIVLHPHACFKLIHHLQWQLEDKASSVVATFLTLVSYLKKIIDYIAICLKILDVK